MALKSCLITPIVITIIVYPCIHRMQIVIRFRLKVLSASDGTFSFGNTLISGFAGTVSLIFRNFYETIKQLTGPESAAKSEGTVYLA